ncbi:MAG: rhomboid family intramembrane serine protease [Halopseudomonas sp.]
MIKLLELPADEDLSAFTGFLWRHRIRHRITHFETAQQLWLADPGDAEFVIEYFERWRNGEVLDGAVDSPQPQISSRARLSLAWYSFPVTLSLIALSLLLTLLSGFGDNLQWLHWFSFVDFNFQGDYLLFQSIETLFQGGQWWRFLTPIFLHFSLMHLVFNLLWTWELGRRVELMQGKLRLLWLALLIGIVSNVAQFMMTGPLFGGLSGVIFGLMGYTWLWDRLYPEQRFGMPPALMTFMMIWLVLGVSGLIEKMGFGSIANTAHLVGLLSGLACVLPSRLLSRP